MDTPDDIIEFRRRLLLNKVEVLQQEIDHNEEFIQLFKDDNRRLKKQITQYKRNIRKYEKDN